MEHHRDRYPDGCDRRRGTRVCRARQQAARRTRRYRHRISPRHRHAHRCDPPPVRGEVPMTPRGFMPGAIIKNVPPGENDPGIIPCGIVTHIAVSLRDSLPPSGDSGKDWHFYVAFDGTIEQYRSIYFEADAQFSGNSFIRNGVRVGFISIESQGLEDGEWTVAQLASILAIIQWVND